jgi:hypothetical protein
MSAGMNLLPRVPPAIEVGAAGPRRRHLTLVPDSLPDVPLPPISLNGPDGQQGTLPGVCWPALAVKQFQRPDRPIIGWWEIEKDQAVEFLIAWQHKLHLKGELYTRPFGSMFFLMEVMGRPAAVVVLASTCNTWVSKERNLSRYDCVDLARICRSPDRRDEHCLRAVLRLAREYLVPLWPIRYPDHWSVIRAACANSLPSTASAKPDGKTGMYRFDGWVRIRASKSKGGGGKRGRPSKAAEIGDGNRGLWVYLYPGQQPTPPEPQLVA